MPEDITQLGAVAIIFIFFLKEFFSYLKAKKSNGQISNYDKELALINQKLDNHIAHFCRDLGEAKTEIKGIQKDIFDIKIEMVKITALLKNK